MESLANGLGLRCLVEPGVSLHGRLPHRASPGQLALAEPAPYADWVVKQSFINVEENIERFVGRGTETLDSLQAGMQLRETAGQLHKALKHRWRPKGVHRFKTHEEADAWIKNARAERPAENLISRPPTPADLIK
jgi:hypothetical protein